MQCIPLALQMPFLHHFFYAPRSAGFFRRDPYRVRCREKTSRAAFAFLRGLPWRGGREAWYTICRRHRGGNGGEQVGKIVVVAEKPSVARDIARVLKAKSRGEGVLYNDEYAVTWALGHLVALSEPDEIDAKYKRWTDADLPIPPVFTLKVLPKAQKQFAIVKKLINAKDTDALICATDSGREGELIFRYLYDMAKCKKPFKRLWVSSMTDSALTEGLAAIKDGQAYDALYASARCRSQADWLVGMNATRAYTIHCGALLSVGRVQTPTLAILVRRQKEIDAFTPHTFYEVVAQFDGYRGKWIADRKEKNTRLPERAAAEAIAKRVLGKSGVVASFEAKEVKSAPPLLYDLTALQREANRRFGFTASKTLSLAQALYEKHKSLTYPRTDSRFLTHDIVPRLKALCRRLCVAPYAPYAEALLAKGKLPVSGRIVNDAQVRDHHAIIPTDKAVRLDALSADERKVYDLVARRFLAVFFPSAVDEVAEVITRVGEDEFFTRARVERAAGWRAVDAPLQAKRKDDEEDEQEGLPALEEGQCVTLCSAAVREGQTRPPAPHTEASLLSMMENAGRDMEDEALKEALKDHGLGTAATRAAIIERLIAVEYVVRRGKTLLPTEKGMKLIDLLPEEITSAETTGKWERALSRIARGETDGEAFMGSIARFCDFLIDHARHTEVRFPREAREKGKNARGTKKSTPGAPRVKLGACPLCGGGVFENSKGYYCGAWRKGCRFTVWKNALGKEAASAVSPEDMRALLAGETIGKKGVRASLVGGALQMGLGGPAREVPEQDA